MWENHTEEELMDEFSEMIARDNVQFFLTYHEQTPIGFAQCQLRYDYVEGTQTRPVGYLEGIFVLEGYRHQGYAKELLTACETWASEKGCKEFASD